MEYLWIKEYLYYSPLIIEALNRQAWQKLNISILDSVKSFKLTAYFAAKLELDVYKINNKTYNRVVEKSL